MEIVTGGYLPGDHRLVDQIVYELKSQGIFDQFRKECIADVDTKPAYQNLRQRVEGSVSSFLKQQKWKPDMNKNQVREMLRKNITEKGFLETGVERIVDQVVNPKINSVFLPQVEEVVYKFFGISNPNNSKQAPLKEGKKNDLLPKDLEAVSPESGEDVARKAEPANVEVDEESPPFEPLEEQPSLAAQEDSVDSHLSGFSGVVSHESNQSSEPKALQIDLSNQDSQMSTKSSDSRLSIIVSEDKDEDKKKEEEKKKEDKKKRSSSSHKSSSRDKSRHSSSSRDKKRDSKSSGSKDKEKEKDKERDKEKDKERDKEKDKKSSSSSKHSSSSKDRKDSSSKSSKDRERTKSSSSSHKDSKSKSSSKSSSSSKKDDKSRHNSSKKDSKEAESKEKDIKESKDSKEKDSKDKESKKRDSKKDKDDHYGSKEKKSDRRSTDRDSNDGQSGVSGDSKEGGSSKNTSTTDSNTTTNTTSSEKVRMNKPKVASNFKEAQKLMKIRKQLSLLEKQSEISLHADTPPPLEGDKVAQSEDTIYFATPTNEIITKLNNVISLFERSIAELESPGTKKRKAEDSDVKNNNLKKKKNKKSNAILTNEKFPLPLSPAESDTSKEEIEKPIKKVAKQRDIVAQQRYSSEDLYKPRSSFASSRRRGLVKSDN